MGRIRFEKSAARQEHELRASTVRANYTPGAIIREVEFDESAGPWVQFSRDTLCTQAGEEIAAYNARRDLWVDDNGDVWTDITITLGH